MIRADFHNLDFVEAPAAPGPSKGGVERLDFVCLKVSCSHVFGFAEAVLVFSRNVPTTSETATPPGQFFGVCN